MESIGVVLTYHTNIRACGVAKFNHLLASKLNVPVCQMFKPEALSYSSPLISIKPSEFSAEDMIHLDRWIRENFQKDSFSLFLHDYQGGSVEREVVGLARRVYCGNDQIYQALKSFRTDVLQLWAPAMLIEPRVHEEAELTIFSFGMAHKLQSTYYKKLKELLELSGSKYRLFVSTALHEGLSFDDSFELAFKEIEEIFPGRAYFLGFLSDSAVFNYLVESTFYAAFFPKGVRGNNTSVHAAMEAGSVVITNFDDFSPKDFIHGKNILDIHQLTSIPCQKATLNNMGREAIRTSVQYGWDAFANEMKRHELSSNSLVLAPSKQEILETAIEQVGDTVHSIQVLGNPDPLSTDENISAGNVELSHRPIEE